MPTETYSEWKNRRFSLVSHEEFLAAFAAVPVEDRLYVDEPLLVATYILSEDGKAGAALLGDCITALFNVGPSGQGAAILRRCISMGGKRLNCLGDGLRTFYERNGFRVTETLGWDDSMAPEGWDTASRGRPNLYLMEVAR